jgi:hypothetical protein
MGNDVPYPQKPLSVAVAWHADMELSELYSEAKCSALVVV